MSFFLLHHVLFKCDYPFLEVSIDLQIPFDYTLHPVDVLIHVVVFVSEALNIAYEFSLFSE